MDAGRGWDVLAPGIPASPASQQPVVDTHSDWFDFDCLVEFGVPTPTKTLIHNFFDLGLPVSANNCPFLFGTDHNPYLFTFYGDLNLWAKNAPTLISARNRFDPFETPIDNLHFARIFFLLLERKWFFPNISIDLPNSSRHRNSFPSIIHLLPAMD